MPSALTPELAARLRDLLDEMHQDERPLTVNGFLSAAERHGIGLVDRARERCWIDERVYKGALERGHQWRALAEAREPVPMILFCPRCGDRHIDRPDPPAWTNPPHRSHLCAGCGHIWRPADIATVGVETIATRGRLDQPVPEPGPAPLPPPIDPGPPAAKAAPDA